MSTLEKYPVHIPWDLNTIQSKDSSTQWVLSKADTAYKFTMSRIDNNYLHIQRNDGKSKAYKEYEARFTYQRLLDEGYSLAAFSRLNN